MQELFSIKNAHSTELKNIPTYSYEVFSNKMLSVLKNEKLHCVNYFAYPEDEKNYRSIACIANDQTKDIYLLSYVIDKKTKELPSLTPFYPPLHIFEREIFENFGIIFQGHPWLKPVRYPFNRFNKNQIINNYPFYQIESEELHEVGVGPVHAGVIEPGHFRFICNGEMVLHLEIQLGWQHRGIENLFVNKQKLIERTILAEGIAGDTTIGHTLAFAQLFESLTPLDISYRLMLERGIALELERIAIHTGDLSALCVDIAYSLGANTISVLRTGIINLTQYWGGNRLGRGLIRVGGTHFPFNDDVRIKTIELLNEYEERLFEILHRAFRLPSVGNRFDDIGTVNKEQALNIGSVGMAARMAGLKRDIRESHPFSGFYILPIDTVVLEKGDVFSRFLLRRKEIRTSLKWIREAINMIDFSEKCTAPISNCQLNKSSFAISLTEGWRGEICHCGVTDEIGNLKHYKIKDPSLHNWKSLELSLRNLEISDFPIINKSYNLSYCGHDL